MEQTNAPLSSPEETAVLESLFQQAAEGMVLIGPDYTVRKYNPSFAQQYVAPQQEILGAKIDTIFPDWEPVLVWICAQVRESREPFIDRKMKIVPVFGSERTFIGWMFVLGGTGNGRFFLSTPHRKRHFEQFLSAVALQNTPVGTAVFKGASLRLEWANPVCREFMEEEELSEANALGHVLSELIPGAEASGLTEYFHQVAETGEPYLASDFRIDGFKRGVVYCHLAIIRLESHDHEEPLFLFIIIDRTDEFKTKKQTEVRAGIAETGLAQMEAVMNSLTEGIIIINLQRQIVYTNPAGLEIIGFRTSDEALRSIAVYQARFLLKDLSARPLPTNDWPLIRALRGETFLDLELIVDDLKQERSWIGSFSGTPVRNRQEELIFGVVAIRDITKAKQAEQEREKLLASERQARLDVERQALQKQVLLDHIGEGVALVMPDGHLLLTNKVALELTGVQEQPETLEGLLPSDALQNKDGKALAQSEVPTAWLKGGVFFTEEEYLLERADGSQRHLLISVNEVKDRTGQVFMVLVTLRDVTELRRLEQTKNDYLQMVSHDLRSPLAVILSHAQLLGLIARDSRICNSAQAIATSSLRMSNMIADLVDSTRLESGQMVLKTTCLDLEWFIRDYLLRMQGVMEIERIQISGGRSLPPVIADPDRLERIIANFISNALKYSPKGTAVEVSFRAEGEWMVVAIRDQGKGIKASDLPHVFDRFFRVRSLGEEGIGLGLYIAKNLVEAHGGKVWVESTPGIGSTFFFTLPVGDRETKNRIG